MADIAHADSLQEPDELEAALAVIRKNAGNEAFAGRIFESATIARCFGAIAC